jgi:hypothetical protein
MVQKNFVLPTAIWANIINNTVGITFQCLISLLGIKKVGPLKSQKINNIDTNLDLVGNPSARVYHFLCLQVYLQPSEKNSSRN